MLLEKTGWFEATPLLAVKVAAPTWQEVVVAKLAAMLMILGCHDDNETGSELQLGKTK